MVLFIFDVLVCECFGGVIGFFCCLLVVFKVVVVVIGLGVGRIGDWCLLCWLGFCGGIVDLV